MGQRQASRTNTAIFKITTPDNWIQGFAHPEDILTHCGSLKCCWQLISQDIKLWNLISNGSVNNWILEIMQMFEIIIMWLWKLHLINSMPSIVFWEHLWLVAMDIECNHDHHDKQISKVLHTSRLFFFRTKLCCGLTFCILVQTPPFLISFISHLTVVNEFRDKNDSW